MYKVPLFFLLLVISSFSCPAVEPEKMTIEQLNSRIHEIEALLIKSEGDRFRENHDLSYNDSDVVPLRVEGKKLEGRMIELRQEYDMRLQVLDESIRKQTTALGLKHKQVADLEMLNEAIGREVKSAEASDDEAKAELLKKLKSEQEQMAAEIASARAELKESTQKLSDRKKEVTAGDKQAGELKAQLQAAEAEFAKVSDQLHGSLNEKPEIQALDTQRHELAAELQRLGELKKNLLKDKAK